MSHEPLPYQEGGYASINALTPNTPSNTRISWEDSTPTEGSSLVPGRLRPGKRVDLFRIHNKHSFDNSHTYNTRAHAHVPCFGEVVVMEERGTADQASEEEEEVKEY